MTPHLFAQRTRLLPAELWGGLECNIEVFSHVLGKLLIKDNEHTDSRWWFEKVSVDIHKWNPLKHHSCSLLSTKI